MSVTIWNPAANEGSGGIARVGTPVYTPAENPEEPGTTEIVYGPPLARMTDPVWVRPRWHGKAAQADPRGAGAANFEAGWVILVDETAPPSIPTGHKRGPDRETPLVDLETLTAVWWTTVEMDAGDVAEALNKRKDAMKAAITARRWEVETGGITVGGAAIATDALMQAKLSGALQLVQDDDQVVIDWKGSNGTWVQLDAATVTAVARAVGLHVQAAFTREKALHAAVDAAEDDAGLGRIDIQAGSIEVLVEGEWVAQGAWPAA